MTEFFNVVHADVSEHHPKINCPKHGIHRHFISSSIEGYEGHWCMLCWLESLGPSLPLVTEEDD
jgi:hypothetical protein